MRHLFGYNDVVRGAAPHVACLAFPVSFSIKRGPRSLRGRRRAFLGYFVAELWTKLQLQKELTHCKVLQQRSTVRFPMGNHWTLGHL